MIDRTPPEFGRRVLLDRSVTFTVLALRRPSGGMGGHVERRTGCRCLRDDHEGDKQHHEDPPDPHHVAAHSDTTVTICIRHDRAIPGVTPRDLFSPPSDEAATAATAMQKHGDRA
ncbi:hypothetical protein GCM10017691_19320 [Pseudonocardia petroleophila]